MSEELSDKLRLSGERLAEADNNLRIAYNNHEALDKQINELIEATIVHVNDLRTANMPADALMCAVGALLTSDVYRSYEKVTAIQKLKLLSSAIHASIDHFESTDSDGSDIDHRGYILSYLASLLYYNYQIAVKDSTDEPIVAQIYGFLNAIKSSGAIQWPKILLGETEVDPATPGPLFIDVLSRAAATSHPTYATGI